MVKESLCPDYRTTWDAWTRKGIDVDPRPRFAENQGLTRNDLAKTGFSTV